MGDNNVPDRGAGPNAGAVDNEENGMATQMEKAQAFRALHARAGAFVIPNPWDAGSARFLAALGFEALATTSAGFAFSLGRPDGAVTLEEKIAHCRVLCAATRLPVSADLENCFADDPKTAAQTIARGAEAGLVGGSIEDWSGSAIYDFNLSVERVQAAVEVARTLGFPFTLTARAENLLRGRMDMDDTIRRLQAYAAAGADVLYAPGLKTLEEVKTVTAAVGKPVNVLAAGLPGATLAGLAAAGAKRISVGGALARAAIGELLRAGREMQEAGGFEWMTRVAAGGEVVKLLEAGGRD